MPRKVTPMEAEEQPIQWGKAVVCGAISSIFMMGFIDVFYMMGITPFTYEAYLGTLIMGDPFSGHVWTLGFLANVIMGALFGILYAYCFESIFKRSSARLGMWVGVWHILADAVAVFPFFGSIHEFMGTGLYPQFGILGSSLGGPTVILLITGHLLFGGCMGLFYGPVRADRIRAENFEPGETGVPVSEGGISVQDDPEDRAAV